MGGPKVRLWGRWWLGLCAAALVVAVSGPAGAADAAGRPPAQASADAISVVAPGADPAGTALVTAGAAEVRQVTTPSYSSHAGQSGAVAHPHAAFAVKPPVILPALPPHPKTVQVASAPKAADAKPAAKTVTPPASTTPVPAKPATAPPPAAASPPPSSPAASSSSSPQPQPNGQTQQDSSTVTLQQPDSSGSGSSGSGNSYASGASGQSSNAPPGEPASAPPGPSQSGPPGEPAVPAGPVGP